MSDSQRCQIGLIGEDISDLDVLQTLIVRLQPTIKFSFSHFRGHGSGKIKSRSKVWIKAFETRGLDKVILMHDLDDNEEIKLRTELNDTFKRSKIRKQLVLIPVREIESWLLCDPQALKRVFSLHKVPKKLGSVESINDPKKKLAEIVKQNSGDTKKVYFNTLHNKRIAQQLDLNLIKKCASFLPLVAYLDQLSS